MNSLNLLRQVRQVCGCGVGGYSPVTLADGGTPVLSMTVLKRLARLSRPEWAVMFGATLLLLIASGASLAVPKFIGNMVDTLASGGARSELNHIVLQMALVFVVGAISTFLRTAVFQSSATRVVARLRLRLFHAIMAQEMAFFDESTVGDLSNRLASDTTKIQAAATTQFSGLLQSVVAIAIRFDPDLHTRRVTCPPAGHRGHLVFNLL